MLVAEFDSGLMSQVHALESGTEQHGSKVKFEIDPQMPEFAAAEHPAYFEIRLANGKTVARSPSLGKLALSTVAASSAPIYENLILPDGRPGRKLTLGFTPRQEHDDEDEPAAPAAAMRATVAVARETAALDATLLHLRWLLIALFGLAILVSGIVLFVVVGGAMRSVNRVAGEIERFEAADLSRRLTSDGVPLELLPVVDHLNGLLIRLQDAFSRERAFTADVAHELRTPLAGLHTTLQVARSRPRDRDAYEAMIDKCLKMTGGIRSMVETLLLLARADAEQLDVTCSPVDVSELIGECWSVFQHRADERGLRVEWELADRCTISADAEKLRIVINNLLDNAISYSDDAGLIRINARRESGQVTVQITNTGSQITEAETGRLFQRFWRGDASRSNTGVHYGLGLSLCRRLMGLIGGRITAESARGVFVASIFIPAGAGDAA
jgi:heavy metal sensor kinase